MEIFVQNFFAFEALYMILIILIQLAIATICYFLIDAVMDEGIENPIVTFLILFFIPFGFIFELFRNTSVNNYNRLVTKQMSVTKAKEE